MPYRGHIANGKVVLDEPGNLLEGAEVIVLPCEGGKHNNEDSLYEITDFDPLREFIGVVHGPADLAEQHDHYLYGTPKNPA